MSLNLSPRQTIALGKCFQDAQNASHDLAEEKVDPVDAAESIREALDEARRLCGFDEFSYTGEHGEEDEG